MLKVYVAIALGAAVLVAPAAAAGEAAQDTVVNTVPVLNDKFCTQGKAIAGRGNLPPPPFDLCIDTDNRKQFLNVHGHNTQVWDGHVVTTLGDGPDGNCSSSPGNAFYNLPQIAQDAVLIQTTPDTQLFGKLRFENWDGPVVGNCTANSYGTKYSLLWTVSSKVIDGMQDLISTKTSTDQCLGGKWVNQGVLGNEFSKYTRTVDPKVFERPPSYCYDAHHWVQSYSCSHTTHDRHGTFTTHGCRVPNDYTGCCTRGGLAVPMCESAAIKDCSVLIYGKANPQWQSNFTIV